MTEPARILYGRKQALEAAEFRRVLAESGLGATRPIDDTPRLQAMLSGANLVLAARLDQPGRPLVGIARCIADFSWCCYLAELAVSRSAQGLGVSRGLLDEARRQLGPKVTLNLISVPEAIGFYERAGMSHVDNTFAYRRTE
jgi:GNAT superfamily N-acetyltransferase